MPVDYDNFRTMAWAERVTLFNALSAEEKAELVRTHISRWVTFERGLFVLLLVALAASCVKAPFPQKMYLQHLPTAVAVVLLPLAARRRVLSPTAFA